MTRLAATAIALSALLVGAGIAGARPPWRWTTAQAEYYVRADGHPSLTASCRGLGKATLKRGTATYGRFNCTLTFPDGSAYVLVVDVAGRTRYRLVSSRRVHGPSKGGHPPHTAPPAQPKDPEHH